MKLEVGQTYYDPDDNEECTITEYDPSDNTYRSSRGYWFTADGEINYGGYYLQAIDDPTVKPCRPVTFLTAVDALSEEHGLTVAECSVSEGVYTIIVVGE